MTSEQATSIINNVTRYTKHLSDVMGVLLIGSWAWGRATAESDLDIVILVADPQEWLQKRAWLREFGEPIREPEFSDWGAAWGLRVFYANDIEVEFSISSISWASTTPIDKGTLGVVATGAKILYDPLGALKRLLSAPEILKFRLN